MIPVRASDDATGLLTWSANRGELVLGSYVHAFKITLTCRQAIGGLLLHGESPNVGRDDSP